MLLADLTRRLLGRERKPDVHSRTTGNSELDSFISERQANRASMTDAEVDALSDAALARVDPDEFRRAADALDKGWKVQRAPDARRPSQ